MFTEAQKEGVAHYMAHSTAVANQHYRMRKAQDVVNTATLMEVIAG